jgi:tripartite-type tricarboxylate transporter receptor subunit TctC
MAVFVLLMTLCVSGCQRSSEYPNRPILLICPWGAGGGTDRVSRQVAALLEQELDVPVNVINATGGAGVTGHTRGALANPDGYTLTMVTVEINMMHWRGLTNVSPDDFAAIGKLNVDSAAVFVRDDAPWQTLQELQQHIVDNPRQLKASGTATGGIWHLGFAGWLNSAGMDPADAIWISINGAAPSLQQLLSEGVDVVCCSLPEARSLLESGRVRSLGVMAEERLAQFPEVPTFREQGIDWTLAGWRGICMPKDTSPEIKQHLFSALERVVAGEVFGEFMSQAGFNVAWQPHDEFATDMAKDDQVFGDLLTSEAFQSVQTSQYGPMLFPAVIGFLLLAVLVALTLQGGLSLSDTANSITRPGLIRLLCIVVWVAVYILLVEYSGFLITAAVLLASLLIILRNRWSMSVAVTLLVVPITYHLFAVGLRVPLPHGWFGW